MSTERHPGKYQPKHRSKRGNKIQRRTGPNSGSRFQKQMERDARLVLLERKHTTNVDDT